MGVFDPHFTEDKAKGQRDDLTDPKPRAGQCERQVALPLAQKASVSWAASPCCPLQSQAPGRHRGSGQTAAARWDRTGRRRARLGVSGMEARDEIKGFGWGGPKKLCRKVRRVM